MASGTCALVTESAGNRQSVDKLLAIHRSCCIHIGILRGIRSWRMEEWAVGFCAVRIEPAKLLLLLLLWWRLVVELRCLGSCSLWVTEFAVCSCASGSKLAVVRPLGSQGEWHLHRGQTGSISTVRVGIVAHRLHKSLACGRCDLLGSWIGKWVDVEAGVGAVGAVGVIRAECLGVPEFTLAVSQ